MEWRHHRIWILAVIVLAGLALAWFMLKTPPVAEDTAQAPVATTSDTLTGKAIYTNGEYGFSIFYPEVATVENAFSPTYHLNTTWRANALPEATGTPIASILVYSTESDHSYPRYFNAQVRIGASNDPKEIAQCLKPTPNQGETQLADVVMNGTTWKVFSFENAGMMQYAKGVSYRTIHEGSCVALEKIQTGSSYRDDPDSPDDIADEVLQERYGSLDSIVSSFTFARP